MSYKPEDTIRGHVTTHKGKVVYDKPKHFFDMYRIRQILFDRWELDIPRDKDYWEVFWLGILITDVLSMGGKDWMAKMLNAGISLETFRRSLSYKQQQSKKWKEFDYYFTYYFIIGSTEVYEGNKELMEACLDIILSVIQKDALSLTQALERLISLLAERR